MNTSTVIAQPSEDEGDHLPGWPGLQLLPVLLAALVRPQRGHGDGEGEQGGGDSGGAGDGDGDTAQLPGTLLTF